MKIFKYSIILLTVIFIYKLTFAQRESDGKVVSHWSSYSSPIAVTEAGNGSIIAVQNEYYGSGKDIFVQLVDSADYNTNLNHESLKKKQSITNNNLLSSQRLSRIYCQTLFETTEENGLNAIAEPGDKKYKKKNPNVALGLAFVPGFFIHGLGHYYIGDYWVGSGLLMVETISIGTIFWSGVEEFRDQESSSEPRYPTETLTTIALVLFFGSWIYDFCGAPYKASKMNKEHKSSFYIYPEIKQEYVSLNLKFYFEEL